MSTPSVSLVPEEAPGARTYDSLSAWSVLMAQLATTGPRLLLTARRARSATSATFRRWPVVGG